MKKVLITNDDGISSIGIRTLVNAVHKVGWDAVVVAPKQRMSGASRGRISNTRYSWEKVDYGYGYDSYSLDGSPASCVVFALTTNLFGQFDLCVSGINAGENLGAGLTISGTFGAVLEAASYKVKGVALSREYDNIYDIGEDPNNWDWEMTEDITVGILEEIDTYSDWKIVNVNIPSNASICTPHVITTISNESYFFDYYDLKQECIVSSIGYDKSKISRNDDIDVLRNKRQIGISLLDGLLN